MLIEHELPTFVISRFTRAAPVDIYALAEALGIEVEDAALPANVSGKIFQTWSRYRIEVNKAHPRTRRRFTVAHEIAHFVLHRDRIGDGITDDALYRSDLSDEDERQANAYGASILMPAPLVKNAFRSGTRSYVAMAEMFDVSPQVAEIRMKELRLFY